MIARVGGEPPKTKQVPDITHAVLQAEMTSEPFRITFGPERISGTLNLTRQDEADEVIRMLTAMKVFLKTKEAAI